MNTNENTANVRPRDTAGSERQRRSLVGKWLRPFALLLAVAAAGFLLSTSVVFVDESEYGIVERFGDIVAVYDRPEDRGFHWKCPWPIDAVRRFDRRVQLFDPPGREVISGDKKNIAVSAYVSWKIADPDSEKTEEFAHRPVVRFFRSLGNVESAESRLDGRIRSLLSTEFSRTELSGILNVTDSDAGPKEQRQGRLAEIARTVRRRLESRSGGKPSLREELGIEIVDLRIRRFNFPSGNWQSVHDRMASERKEEADTYRSAGRAENKAIRSRADRDYDRILTKARADAERIRGAAKAKAIAIRNTAQASDPEFYIVMRTLETYQKILNERTTLILSSSSRLLRMLTQGIPDSQKASLPGKKPSVKTTIPMNKPAPNSTADKTIPPKPKIRKTAERIPKPKQEAANSGLTEGDRP